MIESNVVELDFAADGDSSEPQGSTSRRGRKPRGGSSAAAPRGAGASRPTGAAAKQLAEVLAKIIGGLSDVVAVRLIENELAAMTAAEAQAIAEPAARLMLRSKLGSMLGKRLAASSDALDLAMALAAYGLRVAPLYAEAERKRAHERSVRKSAGKDRQSAGSNGAVSAAAGIESFDPSLAFAGGLALDLSAFP